jgi:hypothetical protein
MRCAVQRGNRASQHDASFRTPRKARQRERERERETDLEDVVDKRVEDRHGLVRDTGVGVDLLEDLVDVGRVRLDSLLVSLLLVRLVALGLGSLGGRLFGGSLGGG